MTAPPPALQPLAPGVHYFAAPCNSFVVENGRGGALIVDTGLDDSHAKRLLRALEAAGLTPSAILNTHAHADHHGGNRALLARFPDLTVYGAPGEDAVMRFPLLSPSQLYGARPPRLLQGKFLLAPPNPKVEVLSPGPQELGGAAVTLTEVPGHAPQMFAVQAGDVLYAADALFGPPSLSKHPLTFCTDSAQQKASAARLGALPRVRVVLPGHGDPTTDLAGLIETNLSAFERVSAAVLGAVRQGPATPDELLVRVCAALDLSLGDAANLLLGRGVVSAHLIELLERREAELFVEGNRLLFRALA